MMASRYGHLEATTVLIEQRADVNKGDPSGWTSLHRAASAGHIEVLELLIEHKANIDQQSKRSKLTALSAAARSGQVKVIQSLLRHKASALVQDSRGQTPLLIACSNGHEAVVRTLSPSLESGCTTPEKTHSSSLSITDDDGRTPLMAAAETGSFEAVRFLLTLRTTAKGNLQGGCTDAEIADAMKRARTGGHVSVARLLLSKVNSCKLKDREDIYACHQQTYYAQQHRELWLAGIPIASLRLSMPPFNKPPAGVTLHTKSELYIIPVYGLRISRAIMECFELDGMEALVAELGICLPRYGLSKFIQGKMFKVKTLIDEAGKRDDCKSGTNAEALRKLTRFVNDFTALKSDDIDGPGAWHDWVRERSADDWMDKMEFSDLLSNFGFTEETAKAIQFTEIDDHKDDGTMVKEKLEQYSLRWLSKAFAGYNVVGCLTDVANLLFAMQGPPPAKQQTEDEVVAVIREVISKLRDGRIDQLWIPTRMIHDAETDDMLAWLLLSYAHRRKNTDNSFQARTRRFSHTTCNALQLHGG
jgi:hypothetical protein